MKINYCDPITVEQLKVVHYGSRTYNPKKFKNIANEWVKPKGGLWTSPVKSQWGWKHWCKAEDFRRCIDLNSFRLSFKKNTRIIKIDSLEDLIALPSFKIHNIMHYVDFKEVAKIADAIWLTEMGERKTRHSSPSLYGWDVESVLILNKDCIVPIIKRNRNKTNHLETNGTV